LKKKPKAPSYPSPKEERKGEDFSDDQYIYIRLIKVEKRYISRNA